MKCAKCGIEIDKNNCSAVNNIFYCSDDCNIKHHDWDKIPAAIALLKNQE